MLKGQMVTWLYSPRTWFSLIALFLIIYVTSSSFQFNLERSELYAYAGETAYYYLGGGFGNITLTSALFLIMMTEIPLQTSWQNDMLLRSNRRKWLGAQIVFCLFVTALMIVLMLTFTMLTSIPYLRAGSGWSDAERLSKEIETAVPLVTPFIRSISPAAAALCAAGILFFFWFTMTMVILFFSLCGKPSLGVLLYVFLLILHVTVLWEFVPRWLSWHPISFSTANAVLGKLRNVSGLYYVLAGYVLTDALFIYAMYRKIKRMDIFFIGKDTKI